MILRKFVESDEALIKLLAVHNEKNSTSRNISDTYQYGLPNGVPTEC